MGAKIHMFDYPDTEIPHSHDVIGKMEDIIREVAPQRIYTHSVKDTHQDHRNVAYASLVAARNVPEIFFYESPSLYLDFNPNYYVDISGFMDRKLELLNLFVTQNGKGYMKIDAIKGLAQFRGLAIKIRHAEAFEIFRILKKDGV
jgi:LmbE family N-acetylglucosaminyl deacetylase